LKNYSILPLIFCTTINVIASENDYLSQTKQDILNYSYDKAVQDSKILKNDWINAITYKYIYSNTETYDTSKSYISISQPIFKSGGIYYAIKYANSVKNQTNVSIDVQKKELIKQTVNLLYQIKQIHLTVNKQKLLVTNSSLDVQRKKEQVFNGILDTSFLDNAILDLNSKQNSLIDLEYQRTTLINDLSKLSDKKYEELKLPILSITNTARFMENNIYIQQAKDDINTAYWLKNMTISSYLPTVNFTADYTKYHNTDNNQQIINNESKSYGFNITIPLDIKYSYNIQSSKIEYLKNKAALKDKKREEEIIFDNSLAKIESLNKKIEIAKSDIRLYDSLVTQIKEQLDVGMKTPSDLETIQNSQTIKTLEIKSLNIDKQIELLEIYYRMEI
jgi:outer membrane protein TolC